jgi:general secretion pathway protein D
MKLTKVMLGILLVLSTSLYAQEEVVDLNLRNLEVRDFIEMISKITQKNILIEEDVRGKVNFISTKPIKKSSLFTLANSILASKNLTLIDQGDFYKIAKSNTAAGEGVPVSGSIKGDTFRTVMFPLKNTDAAVIRAKIKPLLDRNDQAISFKENNTLAITAKPRTLESIAKMIDMLEEGGVKTSTIVQLKNANINDIFNNVSSMAKNIFPQTINSEKVEILKAEATNAIILVGKEENTKRMIEYIRQLDVRGESVTQKMYVLELKNSNVEDMETLLNQLVAQMNNMVPSTPGKSGEKSQKAMVVSDVERNALIILATAEQMKNIRETVERIDVPKAQVYVKARIVEINNNLAQQIGIRYGFEGGAITSQGLYTAAANMGASSIMVSPTLLGFLNSQSVYTSGDTVVTENNRAFEFAQGISEVFALGAKLDLLKQNGAAHILSEPSVLCTNNKEAAIQVGQTQSILTQAQQSTQGQGNIINSYSREDIGITLKVKPRLSSKNQVTLEVEAEIEDILPGSSATSDRPTTTKRKVTTNAIVKNGDTIILGGLIKSSGGENVTRVPVLGDIPVLGELFTSHSDANSKVNVVIYLTPYIVRKSGDFKKLRAMLNELEEIQTKYNSFVREGLENREKEKKVSTHSRGIPASGVKSNLSVLEQ